MSQTIKLPLEPANDDTIDCFFFCPLLGSDTSSWQDLCKQINDSIKSLTQDYIWHREEFQVYVPIIANSDTDFPCHLCSTTCFGDNIEDEWFIVHVLLEISKQYKNLIIQVKDNDGDFLLIEAANCLQSWAKPENTDNRVFIFDHHIHLIPPEMAALQDKLELKEALKIIYETPKLTQASHNIQQAILNRIGNYPEKLNEHIHRAVVKLPSTLAVLLTLKPSLIAPIVDAYCNHDMIDAKCCKNIDLDDCVTVEVKFTKFLYATLLHSKLSNHSKHYIEKGNDKKSVLGFKLMCGYQMIMNKASATDLFESKEYQRFLLSLQNNGYFRNNIKGSKEYNILLEKAQHYFAAFECPVSTSVSQKISELKTSSDFTIVKDKLKCTLYEQRNGKEDDEDWLNIHPEQLNKSLYKRYGKETNLKHNDIISSQSITQELSSFLKQTSDFEGIEPDHMVGSDHENIDFESDQFVSCIEKMLNMLSTGCQDPDSSDSEDLDMYNNEELVDDDECDRELKAKLRDDPRENLKDSNTVLANMIQSMKEEKASMGPSSNLMRSVGVSKIELLDSDDD